MDRVFTETATAHAFEVHAASLGRVAKHSDVGGNVLADGGAHAGKAVGADMAVLVNQGEAGQDRPVFNVHMTRQRSVIDQDAVVANDTVVTNVRVSHDQVVVAKGGLRTILHGATMNRDAFTDDVVITNDQACLFTFVLQVRRVFADRRKLVNTVVLADSGGTFEDHMRPNDRALANFHTRTDNRPRADLDTVGQNSRRVDDGSRVNQTHT